MLKATGIHKSHGDLHVLRGVDVSLTAGEVVSIVGPSGAGKTTLLNVLSTLDRADSGSVIVENTNLSTLRDKALARFRNTHIGFVFQFHQLLPEFNALENAMLPALVGGTSEKEAEAAAMARLEELGLAARAKHLPSQLSGGEQQRVAVARALVNNPPLLFADEPSGNLDSENGRVIQDLFFQLKEELGLTLVVVTHDQEFANRFPRLYKLRNGVFCDE